MTKRVIIRETAIIMGLPLVRALIFLASLNHLRGRFIKTAITTTLKPAEPLKQENWITEAKPQWWGAYHDRACSASDYCCGKEGSNDIPTTDLSLIMNGTSEDITSMSKPYSEKDLLDVAPNGSPMRECSIGGLVFVSRSLLVFKTASAAEAVFKWVERCYSVTIKNFLKKCDARVISSQLLTLKTRVIVRKDWDCSSAELVIVKMIVTCDSTVISNDKCQSIKSKYKDSCVAGWSKPLKASDRFVHQTQKGNLLWAKGSFQKMTIKKNCHKEQNFGAYCAYSIHEKGKVGLIISKRNPCDHEICSKYSTDLVESKLVTHCDNGIPMIEPHKSGRSTKTMVVSSVALSFAYRTKYLCYNSHCDIDISLAPEGIRFSLSSSGPIKFLISVDDDKLSGNYMSRTTVDKVIHTRTFGSLRVVAICNSNSIRRVLKLSKHEFCLSKSSWTMSLHNYYICRFKLRLLAVLLSLALLLLLLRHRIIVSYLLSTLVITPVSVPFVFMMMVFKPRCCQVCGTQYLFNHICSKKCLNCSQLAHSSNHFIKCTGTAQKRHFSSAFIIVMGRYVVSAAKVTAFLIKWFQSFFSFGLIVGCIILLSMAVNVDGKDIPDDSDLFKPTHLEGLGFETYNARIPSDVARQAVEVISQSDDGGRGDITVQLNLPARPMSQGGFTVTSDSGRTDELDVTVLDTTIEAERSFLYSTCQTTMTVQTGDTCTEGCDACIDYLLKKENNPSIYPNGSQVCKHKKSGTSNWHCDGFGCLSVDSGCTCAYCYHTKGSDCSDVYKISEETIKAQICYRFQGKAYCMWVPSYQALANKRTGMILDEAPVTNLRGRFYVQTGMVIRVGAINDKGEFSKKFGLP